MQSLVTDLTFTLPNTMPMTQISTPQQHPSRETLEFLRRFARNYRAKQSTNYYLVVDSDMSGIALPN